MAGREFDERDTAGGNVAVVNGACGKRPGMPRAGNAVLFVRAGAGYESLAGAVRATVAQMDGTLPVFGMLPKDALRHE